MDKRRFVITLPLFHALPMLAIALSYPFWQSSLDIPSFSPLIMSDVDALCGRYRWSNCFWHGADVAVFIYPLNCDPQELKKNAYFWLTSASRYGRFVHLVIVANKADLENPETRRVGEAIARFCEAPHYSISAEGEDGPQSIHDTMESISKDTFEINKQPNRQHAHFMDLDFPTEPVFISLLD